MQAGGCTEPGPCPARAPSRTIRGAPAEFRLRRGARVGAISGVSCGRGNLKSRRLSRAMLPHGGPPGEEGQVYRPCLHRFGDTHPVLFQPTDRATPCTRLQPSQVPPLSCLPSTWSPQRMPGPTGGLPEVLRSHTPFPLTGLPSHTLPKLGLLLRWASCQLGPAGSDTTVL